jgi:hypothetical protein
MARHRAPRSSIRTAARSASDAHSEAPVLPQAGAWKRSSSGGAPLLEVRGAMIGTFITFLVFLGVPPIRRAIPSRPAGESSA